LSPYQKGYSIYDTKRFCGRCGEWKSKDIGKYCDECGSQLRNIPKNKCSEKWKH